MSLRVEETCECGASITVDAKDEKHSQASGITLSSMSEYEGKTILREWRKKHQHGLKKKSR